MRYFDKTFFKFTLGFLVIIAISLFIMYAASAYAAGTSKIVILPADSLTILPNTSSGQMTVQSQNENDQPTPTTEKIILTFESSPSVGQFFTASGGDLNKYKYISNGDTNRNFSFKSSTEGVFTINVNAEGETTHQKWNATKQITVSSGASQNNNPNTSGEVLGASSNSSPLSVSEPPSFGGSATNVSSLNSQLEIIAGSDRTTSPGSPIWFQAAVKKNTTSIGPELNWSFGDGNVGVGPLVDHTYKYPGDYVVVLEAQAGNMFSVSRLKVKVIESNILVSDKGQYLEISNNSNSEINLFKWKIENKGRGFIFQPNTIILPNGSIKIDKNLLTLKGYDNSSGIALKNSFGGNIFSVDQKPNIDIGEISKKIENIKNEAQDIQKKIPNHKILPAKTAETDSSGEFSKPEKSDTKIIYEAPKSESLATRLTKFIKRVLFK